MIDEFRRPFDASANRHRRDRFFSSLLSDWWVATQKGLQTLRDGEYAERDPANTGMDVSAWDYLADALIEARKPAYKAAAALVDALPANDPLREDVRRLIRQSKDYGIQHFHIDWEAQAREDMEFQTLLERNKQE